MIPSEIISKIHSLAYPGVLAITGGGANAISQLLTVPGASQTILEAIVPYSENALNRWLGHPPEQYCSAGTARAMAERALQKARLYQPHEHNWGLGCTASLATSRPKLGEHRFFLAIKKGGIVREYSAVLQKGARDRAGEEELLAQIILQALLEAFDQPERLAIDFREAEVLHSSSDSLQRLPAGWYLQDLDGRIRQEVPTPKVLFPGSFRPLHAGHRKLADLAKQRLGQAVYFELSRANVDKPSLSESEIRHRLKQFEGYAPVLVTEAPTFLEKGRLFPGTVFVVGADTAVRIIDPRYYGDDSSQRDAALDELLALRNSFLVAGRCDAEGRFVDLDQIGVDLRHRSLFTGLLESEFRFDISSTSIRGG
ncbi:CinA family protein [Telmatocola sphagniphila]|uniref:CinA family protein n=1 Tax=Telmatocola sphagniphila TaxID=1123043 RepID=A0A8E6EX32_9BACT|nr:CinA family protein [Telmatocola sphagniphila]QVL30836.1 CinA family protein [Telmatocola sphagniphila]